VATPLSAGKSIGNIVHHADVSEKEIERYLVTRSKRNGWPCLKYSNPNMVGYPDRLIALPGGFVVWVELKSRGRKPAKIQQARIDELCAMDHDVYVIDNKDDVDCLIRHLELRYKIAL
jgi:Holliday junction resolvase